MHKNNSVLFLVLLVFSFITSFFLIGPFFPFLALTFFFSWLAIAVGVLKRHSSRFDFTLLMFVVAFAVFIVFRSQPLLIFLDLLASMFLGSVALIHGKEHFSFKTFLIAPFASLLASVSTKNIVQFDTTVLQQSLRKVGNVPLLKIITSVGITVLLLAIILPLLASANELFARLLSNIVNSLHIQDMLQYLFGDNLAINIIRFFSALFIFFLASHMVSYAVIGEAEKKTETKEEGSFRWSDVLLLPKIVIGIVIGVFFITQFQLYFASDEMLRSLHYSNSQQTREIFAQIFVVSLIVFALIYLDKSRKTWARFMTYLLIFEGIFLTGIGFKSVYDYMGIGGFTTKRLWGVAGIFWLTAAYLFFLYNYVRQTVGAAFVKQIVVLSAVTLLAINIANFDYLIYHVKPSVSHVGIDYEYLARLSDDAYAYRDMFEKLKGTTDPNRQRAFQYVVLRISNLQNKYHEFDIREFNASEYQQYLSIKDVDIAAYRDQFEKQKMAPKEQ